MMYLILYLGMGNSLTLLEAHPTMESAIDALNARDFTNSSHEKSDFYIVDAFKFRVK